MKKLLFINACTRGENSRTLELCRYFLEKNTSDYVISELNLEAEGLCPLNRELLDRRVSLLEKGSLDDEIFRYAKLFRDADRIVIGAPYWDMSFPSALKVFVERVSVCGLTFRYTESGSIEGLCRADSLFYITTSGGYIGDRSFGYDYIKGICSMFGITQTKCISCEGLDIIGTDVALRLAETKKNIDQAL